MLSAIIRGFISAALSRSTSSILRMGSLSLGMPDLLRTTTLDVVIEGDGMSALMDLRRYPRRSFRRPESSGTGVRIGSESLSGILRNQRPASAGPHTQDLPADVVPSDHPQRTHGRGVPPALREEVAPEAEPVSPVPELEPGHVLPAAQNAACPDEPFHVLRSLKGVDVLVVIDPPLWQAEGLGELRRVLRLMWSSS